ncbi:hypothetical protein ACHAXH_001190 [Discostella pseudostelligera]
MARFTTYHHTHQLGRICTAHGATSISASWIPCAQPRFDEFASCIVGPWISNQIDKGSVSVEEVMRSCGGAIQGIREIPFVLSSVPGDAKERVYHNRADGGFVYADDGSYSSGPEVWDASESGGSLVMASLAFPDGRRLLMTVNLSDIIEISKENISTHQVPSSKMLELSRRVSTSTSGLGGDNSISAAELDLSQLSIYWEIIQRSRMSNSNQAWSLARVKWEKQIMQMEEVDHDAKIVNRSETASLVGWSYIESISDSADNTLFGDAIMADTINLHMLAVCPTSNNARSVVRCYDSNGLLKSVAFLQGSISNRKLDKP